MGTLFPPWGLMEAVPFPLSVGTEALRPIILSWYSFAPFRFVPSSQQMFDASVPETSTYLKLDFPDKDKLHRSFGGAGPIDVAGATFVEKSILVAGIGISLLISRGPLQA